MKILIAKTAGFCMGVRRAVEMVLEAPDKHDGPICTYGPLIHNPQVLSLLEEKGITVCDRIPPSGSGTVLIRAHGVPPQAKEGLTAAGFKVIDATCPRVIRVQTIIRKHAAKGYASIIIGDRDHPEVIGLKGYAGNNGHVAATLEELQHLPEFEQAIIVAQTTQNTRLYETIKSWAAAQAPHYKIYDTICDSTEKRQAEVQCLAAQVDAVIVVGGKKSGNTQRIYEVARNSGKPAFHIETEEELDLDALAHFRQVGVTAGASTPNWQIKKVCRALESAPYRRVTGWRRTLYRLQRSLLLTNIYVALGAGGLSYASMQLQGLHHFLPHGLVAMLYVLSMHLLNHLTGGEADRYNDPGRAQFYQRYKGPLALLAVAGGAGGLGIAMEAGPLPFGLLLIMSLLGLSYNLKILPAFLSGGRYHRIKDIPGSKTFLIAAAWGLVTTVMPALSENGRIGTATLAALAWVAGLVFGRTAFFDLLDVQGDRLVGRETLPIVLGEKRALDLLKVSLVMLIALPVLASAIGLTTALGYFLAVIPIGMMAVVIFHEKGKLLAGARIEFLTESHFLLAGLIGVVWSIITTGHP
jgi:(E)-4-hydroxy-3-methyl-but-2-enyl pyrophosphate reductase